MIELAGVRHADTLSTQVCINWNVAKLHKLPSEKLHKLNLLGSWVLAVNVIHKSVALAAWQLRNNQFAPGIQTKLHNWTCDCWPGSCQTCVGLSEVAGSSRTQFCRRGSIVRCLEGHCLTRCCSCAQVSECLDYFHHLRIDHQASECIIGHDRTNCQEISR